jgi:serine phosphatase RsbU (regulator of sigma subunit)
LVVPEQKIWLHPGAAIPLYTDGLVEATRPDGLRFDLASLVNALSATKSCDAADIAQFIDGRLDGFRGRVPLIDNITVMAVHSRSDLQPP